MQDFSKKKNRNFGWSYEKVVRLNAHLFSIEEHVGFPLLNRFSLHNHLILGLKRGNQSVMSSSFTMKCLCQNACEYFPKRRVLSLFSCIIYIIMILFYFIVIFMLHSSHASFNVFQHERMRVELWTFCSYTMTCKLQSGSWQPYASFHVTKV